MDNVVVSIGFQKMINDVSMDKRKIEKPKIAVVKMQEILVYLRLEHVVNFCSSYLSQELFFRLFICFFFCFW